MLHSGCVKLHQKFRDFVGLPMGLLREESPKNRMNTGLFGSRSGEYGLKAARRAPQFSKRCYYITRRRSKLFNKKPETIRFRASFFMS